MMSHNGTPGPKRDYTNAVRDCRSRRLLALSVLCCVVVAGFHSECLAATYQQTTTRTSSDSSIYIPTDPDRFINPQRQTTVPRLLSIGNRFESGDHSADATSVSEAEIGAEDVSHDGPFIDLTSESESTARTSTPGDGGIDKDMLVNFVLWMIVVLCLCGLTAVGLRMLNRRDIVKSATTGSSRSAARVVDSLNLGRHRFVQLVEIGGHNVLVASDASGIRSVVPLTDDFDASLLDAASELGEAA